MSIIDPKARRDKGVQTCAAIMQGPTIKDSTPVLDAAQDFVFGEVWSRPGLDRRARRWITLTCVAASSVPLAIDSHVLAALKSDDITLEEMREFALHFAVYCGWPKAVQLDQSISRAAEQLGLSATTKPIQEGPQDSEARWQRGAAAFEAVMTFPGPQPDCAYHQGGILNFVFGEMWGRPGLDRVSRRWITLACVGACDTVGPIQSHIYAALKSEQVSLPQMLEFVLHFAVYAGWPKASILQGMTMQMWDRIQKGLPCFDPVASATSSYYSSDKR